MQLVLDAACKTYCKKIKRRMIKSDVLENHTNSLQNGVKV